MTIDWLADGPVDTALDLLVVVDAVGVDEGPFPGACIVAIVCVGRGGAGSIALRQRDAYMGVPCR